MNLKKPNKEDYNFDIWTLESIELFIDILHKPYLSQMPLSYKFIIFCQVETMFSVIDCWIFYQFMMLYCAESMSIPSVYELWKEFILHPNCLLAISLNEQDIDNHIQDPQPQITNPYENQNQQMEQIDEIPDDMMMPDENNNENQHNVRVSNVFHAVTNIGFKHDYSQHELIFLKKSIPMLLNDQTLCEKEKCVVELLKYYLERFFAITF